MKNIYAGVIAVLVVVAAVLSLMYGPKVQAPGADDSATYSNPEIGLEFAYRAGPKGYVVNEAIPMAVDPILFRFVHVVPAEVASQTPPEGGEGPAQISISVYKNVGNEQSGQWAESHPQYSNIQLKTGEVKEVVVGGANAVEYARDGLYPATVVVVAHGSYVYVFDGAYLDKDSDLYKDFLPLVNSVTFIPVAEENTATSGKLNIDEVCQGALAYMSFPSSVEADAFVAECKEGKRPEVIEKYKADRGLNDDRAI
jgi:hypothetical protein